jgi:soluble lytic murein transglycosylase-like protein
MEHVSPQNRPNRRHLLLLTAALTLLSAGGAAPQWSAPVGVQAAVAPGAALAAADIAHLLGEQNPNLSEPERLRIAKAVLRYSGKYDLDPELVTGVLLVESDARPWARSPKGAQGLMQVMPHMMQPMGMAGNLATIETNIEAGCIILAGNIRRLGEADGVSAYFWGSTIRDGGYLQRVEAARAEVRALASAS